MGVPWVHIGSGCIYRGFKVVGDGGTLLARHHEQPGMYSAAVGYAEEDDPNFTFDDRSSFYSATKAVADKQLGAIPGGWNLRIRMPFDSVDHPKNLITKLLLYDRLYNDSNSMTCLPDLAKIIQNLLDKAPFGTYNSVNTSWVSTRDVVRIMKSSGLQVNDPKWFLDEGEFMRSVSAPRSNCILSTAKLSRFGIEPRHVEAALVDCCRSMA
jgi:dTDP-4-dehydrorhamnose reductase